VAIDWAEILRESGGIIGTATFFATLLIFIFTRGRSKENTRLLQDQNKLLRDEVEDRKRQYTDEMDERIKRFDAAQLVSHTEKTDLLNKLSDSIQINQELGQRVAAMETMVTAKAEIKSFRDLFEEAIKHFTEESLRTKAEHQLLSNEHRNLSEEHKEIKKVLESVDKKVDDIVEEKKP
jgi:acyl-CoA reductase-like NAD-dependent aldehyde dehydrogenase